MTAGPLEGHNACIAVLTEFTIYGFRKTSMAVLAEAAGVARQTLYNRFENKEAVLAWAVNGLIEELRNNARHALQDTKSRVDEVLFQCLHRWLAPIVRLFHTGRHAGEIFALGVSLRGREGSVDPIEGVARPIEQYLLTRKVCIDEGQTRDSVFLLVMAAKGLMLGSRSEAEFGAGLARIIRGAGFAQAREQGEAHEFMQ